MSLDRVPGTQLYIGGALTVRRQSALRDAGITHIVTALKPPLEYHLYQNYEHHVVPVNDMEDENITEHFPACNEFIRNGLTAGEAQGAVLIHCAMGKSRSATLLVAYLLWSSLNHPNSLSLSTSSPDIQFLEDTDNNTPSSPNPSSPPSPTTTTPTHPLTPTTALDLLRRARPMAEPNPSFMSQLNLYHALSCPSTTAELDASPRYQRWCWDRRTRTARARGEVPDLSGLRLDAQDAEKGGVSKDEQTSAPTGAEEALGEAEGKSGEGKGGEEPASEEKKKKVYRCKRCRTQLATSAFLSAPHQYDDEVTSHRGRGVSARAPAVGKRVTKGARAMCSHLWLEQPLGWMREEMEAGKLEGRLECPNHRCGTQVGRYAWQGLRCSCGEWVVPGISLGVGKVDEVTA